VLHLKTRILAFNVTATGLANRFLKATGSQRVRETLMGALADVNTISDLDAVAVRARSGAEYHQEPPLHLKPVRLSRGPPNLGRKPHEPFWTAVQRTGRIEMGIEKESPI
jgi:hypothetical protein